MDFFNVLVKCSKYPPNTLKMLEITVLCLLVHVTSECDTNRLLNKSKQVIIRSLYTKVSLFAIISITISSLNRRLQSYSSKGLQV